MSPCAEHESKQGNLERETGFEPATSTLARSHSTTELLPLVVPFYSTCTSPANSPLPVAAEQSAVASEFGCPGSLIAPNNAFHSATELTYSPARPNPKRSANAAAFLLSANPAFRITVSIRLSELSRSRSLEWNMRNKPCPDSVCEVSKSIK